MFSFFFFTILMKPFELHIMDVAPLAETETQSDHEI